MLNNAIEHSRGENIHIIASTNALFSSVVIVDTCDASRYSGERIFFSSKAVDEFAIWSGAKIYKCGSGKNIDVI